MVYVSSGPPLPLTRVNENSLQITKSTIFFQFNCSWFSDINGAVKYFTIIVTESEGYEILLVIFYLF